jgi:hypothetical protein
LVVGFLVIAGGVPRAGSTDAHLLLTDILAEHVDGGRVNYRALCEDGRLGTYIAQLVSTDPEGITDHDARLAFWINAYNAYTLKIVCDSYPVGSIKDLHTGGEIIAHVIKKTVWDKRFVVIGGETFSLNDVEHKIVRPRFEDPRAHYALVCAAKSCPPLRSEAYEGEKLEAQLNDQGRIFFGESEKNHFDREKRVAYLSKIMDWYSGDFGENDDELLLSITPFLPEELAEDIRSNSRAWKIKHTKYDWSLNE